uniref:Uncharacterized protein n=1 Tax=Tetranychus urticae TaxID=32264 RepID=A0A158P554_TETUR
MKFIAINKIFIEFKNLVNLGRYAKGRLQKDKTWLTQQNDVQVLENLE